MPVGATLAKEVEVEGNLGALLVLSSGFLGSRNDPRCDPERDAISL